MRDSTSTGPGELLSVLRRHLWLAAACAAAAVGAGAALAAWLPPVYETSTLIRVDERSPALVPGAELLAGLGGSGSAVGTELEVLRSRVLAAEVAGALQLRVELAAPRGASRADVFARVRVRPDAPAGEYRLAALSGGGWSVRTAEEGVLLGHFAAGDPVRLPGVELVPAPGAARTPELRVRVLDEEDAVGRVLGGLEVRRTGRDADVLRVTYRAADRRMARDVPNALAERFVALRRDVQKTEARSTAAFLRQQLDTLAVQLTAAEEELRGFREREGVVDLQVEGSAQVGHLAQVQAERSALQAEQTALAGLLSEAGRVAAAQAPGEASPYRRLVAFPALMRNQTTAEILSSLSRLEEQRTEMLSRRRPSDPEVQIISDRITSVEGQLRTLGETYLASLTSQIGSMDGTLGEYRGRLDRIPAREVQLARLSRRPQVLAEMYGQLQTRLKETEIAQAVEDASVRVIDPAVLPASPVSPRKKLIVLASLLLGLLVGVGAGYARELADETVHTRGDLELAGGGVPVLTLVPRMHAPRGLAAGRGGLKLLQRGREAAAPDDAGTASVRVDSPAAALLAGAGKLDPASDAYDWLHTSLQFARPDAEVRTLLVTSALPGDGKTTTAVNYALTLAQRGVRVLLVDADLRRGGVGRVLNASAGPGLAELLAGTATVAEAVRRADAGNGGTLFYIPCGGLPQHPQQLLRTPRMAALLRWAGKDFDRVIVDTPPLNVVADAALIGPAVDGVVLVARAGVTPFGALAHVAEHLRRARTTVLGTVMNDVDFEREGRYDRSYRWYGYGREYYAAGREAVGAS